MRADQTGILVVVGERLVAAYHWLCYWQHLTLEPEEIERWNRPKHWQWIVDAITRIRPMLGHRLADAVLLADEGSRLVVSVPDGDPLTRDMLPQYRRQVLDVVRRVRPDVQELVVVVSTGTVTLKEDA